MQFERSSFNLVIGGLLLLAFIALIGNIVLLVATGRSATELWGIVTTATGVMGGLLVHPPRNPEGQTPPEENDREGER